METERKRKGERPDEMRCSGCNLLCELSGPYGGGAGYPACGFGVHRQADLLSELDACPLERF